jgi:hypothetical protein
MIQGIAQGFVYRLERNAFSYNKHLLRAIIFASDVGINRISDFDIHCNKYQKMNYRIFSSAG